MPFLLLSILGLALGPLLDRFFQQRVSIVAFLEGFVATTILGLVLGHILPEAVEIGGWRCLPVAFIGLIGPQLAEGWIRGSELRIHGTVATLALAGLFLHTLLDGAALTGAHYGPAASPALGLSVVLHRLPVGLTVWWLVRRSAGTVAAAISLLAICAGTLIGFSAGETTVEHLDTISIALFQAFVAGSLVHVVLHRSLTQTLSSHNLQQAGRIGPFNWSGIGALVGIGALMLVPLSGHTAETHTGVATPFFKYWISSAPFLLAGFFLLTILQPAAHRTRFLYSCFTASQSDLTIPPGTSQTVALIFLAAVPVLGLDTLCFSIPMLGLPLAMLRFAAAVLIALAVALLLGIKSNPQHQAHTASPQDPPQHALRFGLETVVDRTAPWILIGFLAAALLEIFLSPHWISTLPQHLDLVGLALLGAVISLPASAALPVALALLHKGVSSGAVIALLITGPILTTSTSHTLQTAFGKIRARYFSAAILICALVTGLIVNHLPVSVAAPISSADPVPIWQKTCGILLGLLFVLSLLRLSPGGWVARLGHTHNHNHHRH